MAPPLDPRDARDAAPTPGVAVRSRVLRGVALSLMLAVLGMALLTRRTITEGEAALQESDVAFHQGELRRSLLFARRAATAYAPGAPHVEQAYARLQAIALGSESKGDAELAAEAWRSVRSAALETKSVWTPRAEELARADRALARLATQGAEDPEAQRRALEELTKDLSPRPRWILVLGFGFALTAIGLAVLTISGVDARGRLRRRASAVGGSLALVGVLCWTLAVWLA